MWVWSQAATFLELLCTLKTGVHFDILGSNNIHELGLSKYQRDKANVFHVRPRDTNTRSSADADNGLDAFSSQSRSTNMVPFSVHCDFSLSM